MVGRIKRFNFSRTQRDQANAAGAHPQRPFAILVQATNPVVGKTIGVVEMQHRAVGKKQIQPVARRAHRQRARLGFQHRHDGGVAGIRAAIFRHGMTIPFRHLPVAHDPQPAIAAGADAQHIVANAIGIIGVGQHRQPAILQRGKLAAARHPQFAMAILRQLRHAVVVRQRARRAIAGAHQGSFLVQHPDVAVLVRTDGGNFPSHARLVDSERLKLPIAITRQIAAFMANPQNSLRVFIQAGHAVALQSRCARAVENREAHAVEPHQPAISAEPEVTIARLHDRRHGVVRQTVLRLP